MYLCGHTKILTSDIFGHHRKCACGATIYEGGYWNRFTRGGCMNSIYCLRDLCDPGPKLLPEMDRSAGILDLEKKSWWKIRSEREVRAIWKKSWAKSRISHCFSYRKIARKSHENHRKPLILLNFFFQIALTSRSDRIFPQDFFSRSSTRVDLSISGKSLGAGCHRSRRHHFESIHPPPQGQLQITAFIYSCIYVFMKYVYTVVYTVVYMYFWNTYIQLYIRICEICIFCISGCIHGTDHRVVFLCGSEKICFSLDLDFFVWKWEMFFQVWLPQKNLSPIPLWNTYICSNNWAY